MYLLTKVSYDYEVETRVYHNRNIGNALRTIQDSITCRLDDYDEYSIRNYAEALRVARNFVTIAKELDDYGAYSYSTEGDGIVNIEMRKLNGRLSVDVDISNYRGEVDYVWKLEYVDSNNYVN